MTLNTVTPALIASVISGIAGLVGALVPSWSVESKAIIAGAGGLGMFVFGIIHSVEVGAQASQRAAATHATAIQAAGQAITATGVTALHVFPTPAEDGDALTAAAVAAARAEVVSVLRAGLPLTPDPAPTEAVTPTV